MTKSIRIELEQVILGKCVLENGFASVADILKPSNFSREGDGLYFDHQVIFSTMARLYPSRPINIVTVCYELRQMQGYHIYVLEICARVARAACLRYDAFMLLEYNIRTSFIDLLQGVTGGNEQLSTRAAVGEILDECLDQDNDIFEIIPASLKHLNNIGASRLVLDQVDGFLRGIDQRIHQIKKLASIDALVENLVSLNNVPGDTTSRMAVSHLTDILKSIIAQGKVDEKLSKQIFSLNKM